MDSEDERRFARTQQKRKQYAREGFGESFFSGLSPVFPELRLYVMEEFRALCDAELPVWERRSRSNDNDARQRRRYHKQGVPYHVMRLFDTMKGFHEGSLDLSGRHPARYHSIVERWLAFYAQLKGLMENAKFDSEEDEESNRNSEHNQAELVRIKKSFHRVLTQLRAEFERKWELKLVYPELLLELADDVLRCIARRPVPIFQRTRLLDLPPELLYKIFDLSWSHDARKLGATCKLLRTVSLPYIYADRSLSMNGEKDIDWLYVGKLSDEEVSRYFRQRATMARDVAVRDANYLRSRPDIVAQIKDLIVRCWSNTNIERAYRERTVAALEFQFTFSRAFETVIPLMSSLTKLRLHDVAITSAVARNLLSLPRLTSVMLSRCKVTSKLRRIATNSTSLKTLFIDFDEHRLDHSVWKFARFFPKLATLSVHGVAYTLSYDEAPPNLLPFNHVPETWNPFLLPTLTHFQITNLGIDEWNRFLTLLEEGSMHGTRPLPLTHLAIAAYDPFDEEFLHELINVLRPAPLQQLVLDGVHYADLELFHSIRAAFPELTSLTIKHRGGTRENGRSDSTSWPRATWEYAHAVSLFPNLTHFGWNYHLERLIYSRTLLRLEEGYDSDEEDFYQCDDEDYEKNVLISLFAHACPRLQTFSISPSCIYHFERNGDLVTFDDYRMFDLASMDERDFHDPPTIWEDHPWTK